RRCRPRMRSSCAACWRNCASSAYASGLRRCSSAISLPARPTARRRPCTTSSRAFSRGMRRTTSASGRGSSVMRWHSCGPRAADLPFLDQAWEASRTDVESYWGEIYAKAPFVVAAHAYGPVMADPVAHVEYLDPVQLLLGFLGQRADIRDMDERLVEHYRTTGD